MSKTNTFTICDVIGILGIQKMKLLEVELGGEDNISDIAPQASLIKAFHHINLAIEELNMCRYFIHQKD